MKVQKKNILKSYVYYLTLPKAWTPDPQTIDLTDLVDNSMNKKVGGTGPYPPPCYIVRACQIRKITRKNMHILTF